MILLEKPITPEEFDSLRLSKTRGRANGLIKYLNSALKMGSYSMKWGNEVEEEEIINIADACFKKAGWEGVSQAMHGDNNRITVKRGLK